MLLSTTEIGEHLRQQGFNENSLVLYWEVSLDVLCMKRALLGVTGSGLKCLWMSEI